MFQTDFFQTVKVPLVYLHCLFREINEIKRIRKDLDHSIRRQCLKKLLSIFDVYLLPIHRKKIEIYEKRTRVLLF